MKIYTLYRKQRLALSLEEAWPFFSTPHNLNLITPDFLHFRITSRVPDEIHSGLIISYRIAAVAGIPMTWVTEIKHVERYRQFVDEQRLGPFRFWHHLHRFQATDDGIDMEDIVHYVMPGGGLGPVLHRVFIARRLEQIFEYRWDYLAQRFGGVGGVKSAIS